MSEFQVLPSPDPRRLRWLRLASRIGGTIAVVLGGWSLWLAFSKVETPERFEALDELQNNAADVSDDLPEWLNEKPRRPRPAVEITHVAAITDEEQPLAVESAGYVSLEGTPEDSITVTGFTIETSEEPAASAAWLTGEIEDVALESRPEVPTEAAGIPAWKRSTKSLKATLHSTRSATQR